jgi:hypothetical protein
MFKNLIIIGLFLTSFNLKAQSNKLIYHNQNVTVTYRGIWLNGVFHPKIGKVLNTKTEILVTSNDLVYRFLKTTNQHFLTKGVIRKQI